MNYYLGIDLGGTNMVSGVVDNNFNIIAKSDVQTNCPRYPKLIMDDIFDVSMDCLKKANISIDELDMVGIGAPGTIDKNKGSILYANNLNFHNVPIVEYLQKKFNKKIFIDNDANAAAYGEFINGAAKDTKYAVVITLGTGVGSGVIIDSKIYSGFNFAASELGHTILQLDGRPCTCGRKGCFEAYCSATALIDQTKEYMNKDSKTLMWELCNGDISNVSGRTAFEAMKRGDSLAKELLIDQTKEYMNKDSKTLMWELCNGDISNVSGRTAFEAMKRGDSLAKELVDKYIYYLSNGITNIVNAFEPEILCIGGGVSKEGDFLLNPIRDFVYRKMYVKEGAKFTKIVTAKLGNDAGIIGAAFLGNSY